MGRGRSSSGGSRGSSSFGGGGRGSSRSGFGRTSHRSHTTVIVGGRGSYYHSGGSPWIGIIVGGLFCVVGILMFFGGFGILFDSFKYSTVKGECIQNEKAGGWYYTTYDYTVDGTDYTNRSMQGWEFPEDIGKVVTIYYLKSDPNVIYEENPVDRSESGILIFFGLVVAGIGAVPLVLCIKEIKAQKSGGNSDGNTGSEKQEEQSKKCPYCGARYNKNSDTCPKCGASRID